MNQKPVPQPIIDMALGALEHLPEAFALQGVEYDAFRSAYIYHFVRDGEPVDVRLGYDFGRKMSEADRAEALADEVKAQLGIENPPVQTIGLTDEASAPDYDSKTVAELRTLATARGITVGAKARKDDIIKALVEADEASAPVTEADKELQQGGEE